jgi:hypothetical protein
MLPRLTSDAEAVIARMEEVLAALRKLRESVLQKARTVPRPDFAQQTVHAMFSKLLDSTMSAHDFVSSTSMIMGVGLSSDDVASRLEQSVSRLSGRSCP